MVTMARIRIQEGYTIMYLSIRLCTYVYVCVRLYTFVYVFIRIRVYVFIDVYIDEMDTHHVHAYHANIPMSIDSELHPLMCR